MCIYAERESVHLFRAFWDNISSSAPNEEKILFKCICSEKHFIDAIVYNTCMWICICTCILYVVRKKYTNM